MRVSMVAVNDIDQLVKAGMGVCGHGPLAAGPVWPGGGRARHDGFQAVVGIIFLK